MISNDLLKRLQWLGSWHLTRISSAVRTEDLLREIPAGAERNQLARMLLERAGRQVYRFKIEREQSAYAFSIQDAVEAAITAHEVGKKERIVQARAGSTRTGAEGGRQNAG